MTTLTDAPALTPAQRRVLAYITEHPGVSRSHICKHLTEPRMRLNVAGKALDALLAAGLIECREVPEPGYTTLALRFWLRVGK